MDNVGNPVLPKVENYVKALKAMLYEGLVTPESLYSSESSNRSTAQIQLTDPSTGHILFIEYCQEFLKEWVETVLIDEELKKHGFKEGDAYITFKTTEADLDTNILETGDGHNVEAANAPKNIGNSTAITTDPNPYQTHKNKSQA